MLPVLLLGLFPVFAHSLRFIVMTFGTRGDTQPVIPLCLWINERGHACAIATHNEDGEWIRSFGIDFIGIGKRDTPLQREFNDVAARYAGPKLSGVNSLKGIKAFKGFRENMRYSIYPEIYEKLAKEEFDVLISQRLFSIGRLIAHKLSVRHLAIGFFPTAVTGDFQFVVLGDAVFTEKHCCFNKMLRFNNRKTYLFRSLVNSDSIDYCVKEWGMSKREVRQIIADSDQEPEIIVMSPLVLDRPPEWGDQIKMVGFWQTDPVFAASPSGQPSAELAEFLIKRYPEQKIILMSFSWLAVGKRAESCLFQMLAAASRNGWKLVLDQGLAALHGKEFEDNVIVLNRPVAYTWLFNQVDLVIIHGGIGTIATAWTAGIVFSDLKITI